nr:DELLA protein GAI1-like [Ipomoea batatas]
MEKQGQYCWHSSLNPTKFQQFRESNSGFFSIKNTTDANALLRFRVTEKEDRWAMKELSRELRWDFWMASLGFGAAADGGLKRLIESMEKAPGQWVGRWVLGQRQTVKSSDMAEVAQKLEQLEEVMGSVQGDDLSNFASETNKGSYAEGREVSDCSTAEGAESEIRLNLPATEATAESVGVRRRKRFGEEEVAVVAV